MKRILILTLSFFMSQSIAAVFTHAEIYTLKKNFLANITQNGAVIASPSKIHPDYYYDWVRDGAIAMDLVEKWFEQTQQATDKNRLLNYVKWVEKIQNQTDPIPGQDILGEPKFYLDGRPYAGPWGRPQNDGPALRASTLTHFAQFLLQHNATEYVQQHLYGGGLNPQTMGVIKTDLEYIAHHWQEKNYDLWEEVYGDHFFTRLVQRKALREGAILARRLNDHLAAQYYEEQAQGIAKELRQHIDTENGVIMATLPPHPGPQKTHELDSTVLLAVLSTQTNDPVFSPNSELVKNTVTALKNQFRQLFPINARHPNALLFGRYPGDTYDGYGTGIGNPWFILTATMAEYYYTLADVSLKKHNLQKMDRYIQQGDEYLALIKGYAPDLSLSEQINLNTGLAQGANSLTWSYVSVLRAVFLREKLEFSNVLNSRNK